MNDLNKEIENLKSEWINEINIKRKRLNDGDGSDSSASIELARRLYECGLRAEGEGELHVAVEQYRRSTLLVSDIERRIERPAVVSVSSAEQAKESWAKVKCLEVQNYTADNDQEHEQNSMILTLPDELLLYIMRWIVGAELDIHSLLLLNNVCKKFLYVSRDEQLWRLICQKLWPFSSLSDCLSYGGSWRSMVIQRPHLLFHGCYIGSVTYVRRGENSCNLFYRPILFVRYFRVFRFRTDGSVTMIMSALEPQDIIKQITLLDNSDISTLWSHMTQSSVSIGTYTIEDDVIRLQLSRFIDVSHNFAGLRHYKKYCAEEPDKQIMNISLKLKHSIKKPNQVLHWISYSLNVVRKNESLLSTFDVNSDKYPRLVFSRVKAFCSRLSNSPV